MFELCPVSQPLPRLTISTEIFLYNANMQQRATGLWTCLAVLTLHCNTIVHVIIPLVQLSPSPQTSWVFFRNVC